MKNKVSLSVGGLYYLVYNVLNLAFPFLTGIYVAHILLPEGIGEVAAAQNVATYFSILAFLGIPTYGLREIAKVKNDQVERNKVFSELFIINLISTLAFTVLYLVLIFSVRSYRTNLELYLVVGISIVLNAFNITWLFEGLEEFRFISLRNIVFKAVAFLCLLVFVKNSEDYLKYAAITVVGTAGNYLANMVYAPKFARFSFDHLNLKRHLKSIIVLVSVNLAIEIYSLMDITMMNFMAAKQDIAFYKYGSNIEKILLQVINSFTMVLVPRITNYYRDKNFDAFNSLVSRGFRIIIIISLPVIVGIFFTSDFIITQLYGVEFYNSAIVLKILSILLFISPTSYLLGSRILLVTNHENKMLICVSLGAAANLIGNFILIPKYFEMGAAFASLISETLVMIIYVVLGREYFRLIDVKGSLLKVIVSTAIVYMFLRLTLFMTANGWIVLIIQVLGSILLYSCLLLLFKEQLFTSYLKRFWNKIIRKPGRC